MTNYFSQIKILEMLTRNMLWMGKMMSGQVGCEKKFFCFNALTNLL